VCVFLSGLTRLSASPSARSAASTHCPSERPLRSAGSPLTFRPHVYSGPKEDQHELMVPGCGCEPAYGEARVRCRRA
jgi:hypothetical protein